MSFVNVYHVWASFSFRFGCGMGDLIVVVLSIAFLFSLFKDGLRHLLHGFRNRYFNKILLDNML